MGFLTINEGEQVLIFNRRGEAKQVCGPRRVWVSEQEKWEYLMRYVASQDQYLVVQYIDGHKENIRGPKEMYMNRLEVDSILVNNAVKLDANHMLVVYKQLEGIIERRIVQGPTIFVPEAHEWLHEFLWHGSDRRNPGHYLPGMNKFTQLRHVPSNIYCTVRDVRTNDISVINVKLMVFFQLADVERMLTYTHDPIADFINAVQADVIAFASQRSYEEFIRQTEDLNNIECYPQLTFRANHIGYKITKVVYRGYEASRVLQATHDDAVRSRMSLRLDAESEEQEQLLKEFRLKREKERTKLKHEMELKQQEHEQELQRMRQAASLDKEKLVLEANLKKEEKQAKLAVELEKLENEQKSNYLCQLQDLGVDTTRYLVSLQPQFQPENELVFTPSSNIIPRT